jgi:hypothetical protein
LIHSSIAFFCALDPAALALPEGQPELEGVEPEAAADDVLSSVPHALRTSAPLSTTPARAPDRVTFTVEALLVIRRRAARERLRFAWVPQRHDQDVKEPTWLGRARKMNRR